MNYFYGVSAGTVNKTVGEELIKYKALLRVDDIRPHMVGIIHNDVAKQTHVLSLTEIVLDSDPIPLAAFMGDYLTANPRIQLSVNGISIAAMLAAMSRGNVDFSEKLAFVYLGKLGPTNTVRYTNIDAIMSLLGNVVPDSEQLTFTLK